MMRLCFWLIGAAVAAGLASTACQSSPPPASIDTAVPAATMPPIAPAGIPPVVGDGVLAIVPPHAEQASVPVTADLGGGWRGTLLVRADRSVGIAVRIQVSDAPAPDDRDAASGALPALALTVQLFDAASGQPIEPFPVPMAFGFRAPSSADVGSIAVYQLDEGTAQYRPIEAVTDAPAGIVTVHVDRATHLALGSHAPYVVQQALAPPVTGTIEATSPAAPVDPAPVLAMERAPLPTRVRIPSIGVDAPIVPVGLEPNGIMAVPEASHVVGWYELGPRPGEVSNAVLTGHLDWEQQAAVFAALRQAAPGDTVEVLSGFGSLYRYQIESIESYGADDAPVAEIFAHTPEPFLTLITCDGLFDEARGEYQDRLVVRARGAR